MAESRRVHQNIANLPVSWNLLHTTSDQTASLSQEQKAVINSVTIEPTASNSIFQSTHTQQVDAILSSSACASSQDPGQTHGTNVVSLMTNLSRVKRKRRPRPTTRGNNANACTDEFTGEQTSQSNGALASDMINLDGGGVASGEGVDPYPPLFGAEAMAAAEATAGGPAETDGVASASASASVPLICAVCGEHALGHNFDCVTCESCKTFFRRNAFRQLHCTRGGHCIMSLATRRQCSACRLQKCLAEGMKRQYIFRVHIDECGKYLGKAGTSQFTTLTNSMNQSENSLAQTPSVHLEVAPIMTSPHEANAQIFSVASNHSSTCSPRDSDTATIARSERSPEDQKWDRLFKPRVAMERARRAQNSSVLSVASNEPPRSTAAVKSETTSTAINSEQTSSCSNSYTSSKDPKPEKCKQSDSPTMPSANRELVSNEFFCEREPLNDVASGLNVNFGSRNLSIVQDPQVMASTTKLSDEDFSFILSSIQRSVDVLRSPITSLEAKSLPPFPKSFSDVMAYGVMALKRMIKSLQHLPYFASLRFEDCNQLLRNAASILLRMKLYLFFEPRSQALVFSLECPEPDIFNPTQLKTQRTAAVLRLLDNYLSIGIIELVALMVNMFNYASDVLASVGNDQIIVVLIAFINLLSPHRFSACPNLHATLTPINAILFQFLEQYIHKTYSTSAKPAFSSLECSCIRLSPDNSQLLVFGHSVPAFERLSTEERLRIASSIQHSTITSRSHVPPNKSHADWLFAFCIAAVNDPRVDESSQRDFSLRIAAAQNSIIQGLLSEPNKL